MDTGPGRTQSLYRKYRPETFEGGELVGQDHVRNTLRNAIKNDRVSHAYLFCGPRGTGKTTTARLLAKAVNCLDPDLDKRPCNVCEACVAINQGRATDIIEIDAASNRGIEDIRDLREQVKYAPTQLRHKFYIIDEAHRLTRDAFNAFLKTLEEPPPNTTFVLATTDPDELLETVASRCQRFDFHRIPADQMAKRARTVCEAEGIEIEDDALEIVIRQSTGSLRDALSLIDMLATATSDEDRQAIDASLTRKMLGLSQDERTITLIEAIRDRDLSLGLQTINDTLDSGQDMRSFGRQILSALRLLMLCRAGADPAEADDAIRELSTRFELPDLLRINREFSEIDFAIRTGGFPQLPIELAFVSSIVAAQAPQPTAMQPAVQSLPPAQRPPAARPSAPQQPVEARPVQRAPEPQRNDPIPIRREPQPEPVTSSTPEPAVAEPADTQPSAPAADGSLDVQAIIERWQEVRTEVKATDRKVEALLASCDPHNVIDGTLYLTAAYPFHATKLNDDRNRMTIEDALERVFKQRVSVSTGLRDELPNAPGPSSPPSVQPEKPSTPRQMQESGPSTTEEDETSGESAVNGVVEPETEADAEAHHHVMERMKAMFNGEEIDLDDLPLDLDTPR